jgi:hypothetical protein
MWSDLEQWFENVRGNHGAKSRDQLNKATNVGLYAEEQLHTTETFAFIVGGRCNTCAALLMTRS